MRIKVRAITPLHIGGGETISPAEYLLDRSGKGLAVLNPGQLARDPAFPGWFAAHAEEITRQRYLGRMLTGQLHEQFLRHHRYLLPLSPPAASYLRGNQTALKPFIKSAGRVYLPGSSLKGALLSGLVHETYDGRPPSRAENREILDLVIGSKASAGEVHNRFARWLDVSDSTLLPPAQALQVSLVRVTRRESEQDAGAIPLLLETVVEGIEFEMELVTELPGERRGRFSPRQILEKADAFYRAVYERDCDGDGPPVSPGSFLARLGHGSGVYAVSLLLLAEKSGDRHYRVYRPPIRGRSLPPLAVGKSPATIKTVVYHEDGETFPVPLGWAEIVPA